ncbi:MAG: DUF3224 domain-containing protein [Pseudohongiellaceae bacterium]
MKTYGDFAVNFEPAADDEAPAGRMIIKKEYTGGIVGAGTGQMLSKRTENAVAVYSAIEEVIGSVDGISGGFTLSHYGFMSHEAQELKIEIIPGSGSGDLASISGTLQIDQNDGNHSYILTYAL